MQSHWSLGLSVEAVGAKTVQPSPAPCCQLAKKVFVAATPYDMVDCAGLPLLISARREFIELQAGVSLLRTDILNQFGGSAGQYKSGHCPASRAASSGSISASAKRVSHCR